jgi:hypothetical protein
VNPFLRSAFDSTHLMLSSSSATSILFNSIKKPQMMVVKHKKRKNRNVDFS